jgi:hypothetical protein
MDFDQDGTARVEKGGLTFIIEKHRKYPLYRAYVNMTRADGAKVRQYTNGYNDYPTATWHSMDWIEHWMDFEIELQEVVKEYAQEVNNV